MAVETYKLFFIAPGNDGDGASSQQQQGPTAEEKAQIRRAQVRKAQIQHRQRKANYIKKLELDVVRIRDMISQAERETMGLRRDNEAMKAKLRAVGIPAPQIQWKGKQTVAVPSALDDVNAPTMRLNLQQSQLSDTSSPPYDHLNFPPPSANTELFADIDINDITVTLSMDSTMGTPCYKISTSSSKSSSGRSAGSPRSEADEPGLTAEQETQAINFILSLEYICWNHFHPKDFPEAGDPSGRESCHTLMASTFCMASAPDNVYKERRSVKRSGSISWPSTGPTLQNLRGLAASLNPGDKELTPVQAWFELADSYAPTVLLDPSLMESLKREFVGVVKCVKYGATIERQAFESIVGRTMAQFVPPDVPMAM